MPVSSLGTTPIGSTGQRLRIDANGQFLYAPAYNGGIYGFRINAASRLDGVAGEPVQRWKRQRGDRHRAAFAIARGMVRRGAAATWAARSAPGGEGK